ncbi:hypothetical protein [Streptacidiphilus sp. EB103A]|uniref:hypothetical protein n=1 Tax=Streptacidiphilus sp. EB103A TaxID=3156275 RepID=UPI0035172468
MPPPTVRDSARTAGAICAGRAGPCDEAALLVTDLAALAREEGTADAFTCRCTRLRRDHHRGKAFLGRLETAGV